MLKFHYFYIKLLDVLEILVFLDNSMFLLKFHGCSWNVTDFIQVSMILLKIRGCYLNLMCFPKIIGFYRNIKNTDTIIYLIAIVGVLIIFTAMYLYLGQSRFRVPLEPILMLLTVLAFNKKSINTKTKKNNHPI